MEGIETTQEQRKTRKYMKRETPARQAKRISYVLEPTLFYRLRDKAARQGISVTMLLDRAARQAVAQP